MRIRNILLIGLCCYSAGIFAQEFSELESHYSGAVEIIDEHTVIFTTSGEINFPDKTGTGDDPQNDQKQNFWEVPASVTKILIKKDVTVTGAFHTFSSCFIEGEDRETSVVYGTPLQKWADKNNPGGQDLYEWYYAQFQNFGGTLRLENIKVLNPFSYFVRGWNTLVHVKNCDFIDNRGGSGNHSDGISGGHGSTVDSCYFETGDDAIKCYFDIEVSNSTINMIQNCVPFQFGWSENGYQDSHTVLRNVKVIGNDGRWPGNPVFQWKGGGDHKTVEMTGCNIQNPQGSLFDLEKASGILDINIQNSYIKLKAYKEELKAEGIRTICGSTEEKAEYDCREVLSVVPGLTEAEDFIDMNGVDTEITSDTSGSENISGIDSLDWMEYRLDVQAEGDYTLEFRVASESENITLDFFTDGIISASLDVPETGGADNWKTCSLETELSAGIHNFTVVAKSNGWKLNWIRFAKNPIRENVSELFLAMDGDTGLRLFWNETINDETGFLIERKEVGDPLFLSYDTIQANSTEYLDTLALEPFTLYAYRIRTLYQNSRSQASGEVYGRLSKKEEAELPDPWESISYYDSTSAMAHASEYKAGKYILDVGDGDFWNTADRGLFVYQTETGDCEILGKIMDYSHVQSYTMAGLMIRDSLDAGAPFAAMMMISTPGAIVRGRYERNGPVDQEISNTGEKAPYWLRLKREGNVFKGFVSEDRLIWRKVREINVPMTEDVFLGMAATSHTMDTTAYFSFQQLEVSEPRPEYLIKSSSGSGGRIQPSGNNLILDGTTISYLLQPEEGYEIQAVVVDGDTVDTQRYYTFSEVDSNHTIEAIFSVISTGIETEENNKVFVYPNPAGDFIFLEGIPFGGKGKIRITDLNGKVIAEYPWLGSGVQINLQNVRQGIYLLQAGDEKNHYTFRIIQE